MEKLTSPKFKSKVEQFYYENGASSEPDLTAVDDVFTKKEEEGSPRRRGEDSPRRNVEQLRLEEARRRAYSGERRGVFTFDPEDLRNLDFQKHGSLRFSKITFFLEVLWENGVTWKISNPKCVWPSIVVVILTIFASLNLAS